MRRSGANLVSYLLFDKDFCRALIDLGYQDALKQKQEILNFLDRKSPDRKSPDRKLKEAGDQAHPVKQQR